MGNNCIVKSTDLVIPKAATVIINNDEYCVFSQLSKWVDGIRLPDIQKNEVAETMLIRDLKNLLHNFKTDAALIIEIKKIV
jgi:hypothetical protein